MNSCRTNWPRKSLQHSIMRNWKWRADMAAIFISRRSMFEHHNFDERRIWRNLGLHMIHINSIIELEMLIPLGWIYVFTAIYRLGLWYLMSQIKDGQKSLWNIHKASRTGSFLLYLFGTCICDSLNNFWTKEYHLWSRSICLSLKIWQTCTRGVITFRVEKLLESKPTKLCPPALDLLISSKY